MTKIEKAEICDDILRRFQGNGAIYWASLRAEFAQNMHLYYVTESNINFLIAEGMIERDLTGAALNLTERGFATLAEIETLGYVAKENERLNEARKSTNRANVDRAIQLIILLISLAGLIIAIIMLRKG